MGEDKPHSSGPLSPPLPPTLPHAKWPGGSTVRWIDLPFRMQHTTHSTRSQSTRDRGSPPPKRCPNTHVAYCGWWWPGSGGDVCVRLPVGWGNGNRTPLGRFADVNWGSRPFDHRVVGGWEGEEEPEMRAERCGGRRGTKRMRTHRLLGLSAHDKGIRQRRSRRSRHFSLYFSSVVSASLSAELVRQTTRRSWKLNRLSANPGASVHFGSRISHTRPTSCPKLK